MKAEDYNNLLRYINCQEYPPELNDVYKKLIAKRASKFRVIDNNLYYGTTETKRKVIIDEQQRKECFMECHREGDCHFTKETTIQNLYSKYYWNEMFNDLDHYYGSCANCSHSINTSSNCWKMIEVTVHGPFEMNQVYDTYILKIIDPNTNFTILKTFSRFSNSELVSILINVFVTFGWPAIVYFRDLKLVKFSEISLELQKIVELMNGVYECLNVDVSPDLEVPQITIDKIDVTNCSSREECFQKSCNFVFKKYKSLENVTLLVQGDMSMTKCDVSTWQQTELLDFIQRFSNNWSSLLPALTFKFNHAFESTNSKSSFFKMFRHPSCNKILSLLDKDWNAQQQMMAKCSMCSYTFSSFKDLSIHQLGDSKSQKICDIKSKSNPGKDLCTSLNSAIYGALNENIESCKEVTSIDNNSISKNSNMAECTIEQSDLIPTFKNVEVPDMMSSMEVISNLDFQSSDESIPSVQNNEDQDDRISEDDDGCDLAQEIHVTVVAQQEGKRNADQQQQSPSTEPSNGSSLKSKETNSRGKYRNSKRALKLPVKCDQCTSTYVSSNEELQLHLKCHKEGARNMYCPYCEVTTLTWCHMLRHLHRHKNAETRILSELTVGDRKCKICNKIYSSHDGLRRHIQSVHEKLPVNQCDTCGKIFKERKTFIRHLEMHTNQELNCDSCGYKTKSSRSFQLHQRMHNGTGYQCEICFKFYPLPSILKTHLQIHEENKQRLICDQCGVTLKSEITLKAHIMRVHQQAHSWPCSKCSYIGKNSASLKHHIQRKHEKGYHCDECDYTSLTSSALKKHIDMFHDVQTRPYGCNQCKYRSKDMKQLAEHVRFQHNPNILRYQCQKCDMKFKTLTLLRDHMPAHTGELIYGCKLCGYRAKHRQTVHAHAKSKHKGYCIQDILDSPGPESITLTKMMLGENFKSSQMREMKIRRAESSKSQDEALAASAIEPTEDSMYEEYTEEVIVQSEQEAGTSQTYIPIADLPQEAVLSLDQSKVNNIILHDENNKEVKVLEFDTSNGKVYTVQTLDDRSVSFVQEENGEITFKSLNFDQDATLQIIDSESSENLNAENSEDSQKSVGLVLLAMNSKS